MIRQIATKLDFPTEAVDYLAEQQTLLLSNPKATALLGSAMDDLFMQNDPSLAEKLGTIATETGIHSYTVDMIFLLLAAYPLRYLYLQKGIDEKIYIDTLKDLKYKLMECKKLHGYFYKEPDVQVILKDRMAMYQMEEGTRYSVDKKGNRILNYQGK